MADISIAHNEVGNLVMLDPSKPLRESLLWKLQTAFYETLKIKAWSDAIVPNFVTSNAFIAATYAKIILGFVRDWFLRSPAADRSQPMYLVEVGSGHGKLTFLILRELWAAREQWPVMDEGVPPFVAVITDFPGAAQVPFWTGHECLQPYLAAGCLDFATFDAEHDRELKLVRSGVVIKSGTLANPLVGIANYIFDTLRQDAFRIVEGQLQEAVVTLYTTQQEADPGHPDIIKRLRATWDYRPCNPSIYKSQHLQAVLQTYLARSRNASILIPIGGITALSNLAHMAGGRLLMLVGDKAYNHEEELQGLRDPHVAVHGSFSFMVNLHAVRLYTLARGGISLHTPYLEGFKCAAFALGVAGPSGAALLEAFSPAPGEPIGPPTPVSLNATEVAAAQELTLPDGAISQLPETLYAWADTMDTFGPDNFSNLQRCAKDEIPDPSLKTALAVIRMAGWDSDVFFKFKQVVIDRTPTASDKLKMDIHRDVRAIAERYFPLQPSKDISFELGRICMGLKAYPEALALFAASQRQFEEHHVSWYNMGICHWYMNDMPAARDCFSRSVALKPDYVDAAEWRTRVEARMQGDVFANASAATMSAPPGQQQSQQQQVEGEAQQHGHSHADGSFHTHAHSHG